jgi:hypothetical protein
MTGALARDEHFSVVSTGAVKSFCGYFFISLFFKSEI